MLPNMLLKLAIECAQVYRYILLLLYQSLNHGDDALVDSIV